MVSNPVPTTLTAEERSLLYLVVTGHSPAQSAHAMHLSPARAQHVLDSLQRRLGLPSRSALIARAILHRWV